MIREDQVISFSEKTDTDVNSINGGYFVFNKKFFSYFKDDDGCVLGKELLERLAADGELKVFSHKGFWQYMDTYRDYKCFVKLWERSEAPWKIW